MSWMCRLPWWNVSACQRFCFDRYRRKQCECADAPFTCSESDGLGQNTLILTLQGDSCYFPKLAGTHSHLFWNKLFSSFQAVSMRNRTRVKLSDKSTATVLQLYSIPLVVSKYIYIYIFFWHFLHNFSKSDLISYSYLSSKIQTGDSLITRAAAAGGGFTVIYYQGLLWHGCSQCSPSSQIKQSSSKWMLFWLCRCACR